MPSDSWRQQTVRCSWARPNQRRPRGDSQNFRAPPLSSHHPPLQSLTMTDSTPVQEAEASMANLLLDDVTGEKVSKTELKRRQKLREKDAKKKDKAAAAPPKAEKKVSAEEEEANLTPNVSNAILVGRAQLISVFAAILRNPKQEGQQDAREQAAESVPPQVPGYQ